MSITHVRIDRSETYQGGRVVSIEELREDYLPDLDLTGVPDDKVAEHVEDAISNHDDPYGELSEWLNKRNECIDAETKVTAFRHTCAGCGEAIIESEWAGWIDANYWGTCGGYNKAGVDAPHHVPAEPVEQPAPASPLVGKTIASVTGRRLVAPDRYGDYIDWTETVLTFTDGTTQTYAVDEREVYGDGAEPRDCEVCGNDIIDSDSGWIHPFGHSHDAHTATPAADDTTAA